MAKTDLNLDTGLNISEITVSKAAKDRLIRLRQEMLDARLAFEGLGKQYTKTSPYREKEKALLGQREATNRMASLGRRMGYSPAQMTDILTLSADINRKLNYARKELRATDAVGTVVQRQKDLYKWVVSASKELEDPEVDQTRPSVQFYKRSVRNAAGSLLRNPNIEKTLGTEKARKVAEIYDKLSENTKASTGLLQTIRSNLAAGAGGIAFGSMISTRAAAIFGDRETPFSMIRDEVNKGMKYTGGIVGAAIGGLAGPLGAAVGGAIGSIIGGYGERSKAASDAAKQDTIQMLRMRNLYGRGSFNSAMLAQNLGYISTEDYNRVASAINIAPYAAAFGEISDRQWIGYSLLPNYMAAVFGGAEPEEAMDALQRDMDGLPLGLAQQAVNMLGNLGPGENVRAFIQSPNYRRWRNAGYTLAEYERRLSEVAPGYEEAIMNEAMKNRETRDLSVRRGTWSLSKYNYVGQPVSGTGAEVMNELFKIGALPRFDLNEMGFVKRELVINIDNNRVDVGSVYTFDGDWLQGATSYSVGSNQ